MRSSISSSSAAQQSTRFSSAVMNGPSDCTEKVSVPPDAVRTVFCCCRDVLKDQTNTGVTSKVKPTDGPEVNPTALNPRRPSITRLLEEGSSETEHVCAGRLERGQPPPPPHTPLICPTVSALLLGFPESLHAAPIHQRPQRSGRRSRQRASSSQSNSKFTGEPERRPTMDQVLSFLGNVRRFHPHLRRSLASPHLPPESFTAGGRQPSETPQEIINDGFLTNKPPSPPSTRRLRPGGSGSSGEGC
ncbi:hypothetical protein EYF80_047989 [Liparis tanakae]|uniref:Uncharacterized protein n=1 Tax=Liparis tanakae TaxID=230148 RepID=A0A4Z2FM34_9TELE|nr:hypothetical protein EYF80_047989 [Liparis tanakae]